MQGTIDAICAGKTRGYSCEEIANDKKIFSEYAIKKNGAIFICYVFKIPVTEMDALEDIENYQSILEFESLDSAIDFIKASGGDFERFGAFKGVKPV